MSKLETISKLLSQAEIFSGLPDTELQKCAGAFREVRFGKGEMLFSRGDPGTNLYLIAEGRVRLAISSDEGRELSFRHATAGDLFGEIAALDGGPRTAEATALTPIVAYSLDRNTLAELLLQRPAIAAKLIEYLCKKLRETSSQLEAIALHPLHVRLARFLAFALENRQAPAGKRVPLELGFSQGELALLLGA